MKIMNNTQLEDIINSFTDSVEVSQETVINRMEYHSNLYKNKSTHYENQEKRRNEFFESQRKKRSELQMELRQLTEGPSEEDETSSMEWSAQSNAKRSREKIFKNKLMLSEWLVEVPPDFATNWLLVICPVGKRCLVIASKGRTKAYSRTGHHFKTLSSCLPGGHGSSCRKYKDNAILDCIFVESEKTFYILDLISWNDVWFYDSEAEFRFFWLDSRVKPEVEVEVEAAAAAANPEPSSSSFGYKFQTLSRYACEGDTVRTAMEGRQQFTGQIDGLLFFHRKSHYTPGVTPLVCWLRPSMLAQVLDINLGKTIEENKMED